LSKLEYQAGHAIVWRDAICNWFLRESGIPDEKGRAGHFPNRVEAESMRLDGYTPVDVTPFEDASGGKAVTCAAPAKNCTAVFRFTGQPGWYDIAVQYFDENTGAARFQVLVGKQSVREWSADANLPSKLLNSDSSTRETIARVALRPNDEIRIVGTPDGGDTASFDYVEILSSN
jgi:alpha-glucuronidase